MANSEKFDRHLEKCNSKVWFHSSREGHTMAGKKQTLTVVPKPDPSHEEPFDVNDEWHGWKPGDELRKPAEPSQTSERDPDDEWGDWQP